MADYRPIADSHSYIGSPDLRYEGGQLVLSNYTGKQCCIYQYYTLCSFNVTIYRTLCSLKIISYCTNSISLVHPYNFILFIKQYKFVVYVPPLNYLSLFMTIQNSVLSVSPQT